MTPPDWPPPDAEVAAAVAAALTDGSWGKYDGGHVAALEADLGQHFGVAHALTCASGTLAVEVALRAAGVEAGDRVLLSAYDYPGNFLSVHAVGAIPTLIDFAQHADLPPAKAVIASHLHGGFAPVRELLNVPGLTVIEDAAQSPGAILGGRPAGSWGHLGTLSFGGSKLLTAGRGGALLTNDPRLAQRARLVLGRGPQQWAALSELQAVALRPQLAKLAERTQHRLANVRLMLAELADLPGLTPFPLSDTPAFYKLGFRLAPEIDRDDFTRQARAAGVALDPGFPALHLGRAAKRAQVGGPLPEAERLHRECVILHHPVLLGSAEDIRSVARVLRHTYLNAARARP